jgi:glyoxylase-like metal-dependent hydrolase (beta-lactamase superfamily II)
MNSVSRRGFLQVAAVSSAGAALAATPFEPLWARAATGHPVAQNLGSNLALIRGAGGNVLAFGGAQGALLIDGGDHASAAALLKVALQSVGAKHAHTLFNTHWHPDQTGLNEGLGKQGVRIIAHENTRLWLTRKIAVDWLPEPHPALPKIARPNQSFYTTDKLEFGDEQFSFGHLGQAHTDGDLYVHLAKANVLAAGGVVSSAGWPLLDWQTGGWIGGLVGAYDRLLKIANDATRVIPANGPVVGRKDLQSMRDMYFQIFDRCVKQLVKGMSPDEAYASGPAKEFEAQWGDSKTFVLAAFKSLWGHYAPDA